jgi:magnesium transporter
MSETPVQSTSEPIVIPRQLDPEDAQLALQQLQSSLKRP